MNETNVQTQNTSPTVSTPVPPATITVSEPGVAAPDPAVRYRGLGTNFKAKLIGVDEVPDSRGDKMCQESILKLKAAVLASGAHKQKIVVNVSLEGIKIVDILTGEVQHVHPVHRISFIARDLTDRRAFGYVYGAGEGRHQFFGIKTAKVAEMLVLALRDLFQVVYDMKKKEMENAKSGGTASKENGETKQEDVYSVPSKPDRQNHGMPPETASAMPSQQSQGSLLDLEQQLTNIQEGINNIDSFGPWPQDLPTSPDTPFSPGDESGSDMFGIANLSDISSLSSDFSCASASVLDYGHAGGGDRGSQPVQHFQRSSSSRSAISWHGFKQGQHHVSPRASSHSARDHRLGSVPDCSVPSLTEELQKRGASQELSVSPIKELSHTTEEAAEDKEHIKNGLAAVVPDMELKKDVRKMEKTRDTLKSSSTQSLPESDKKLKKSTSSSFFSRSKKSSKKSKKPKKEKASLRNKGSKSADEHLSSPALSDNPSPGINEADFVPKRPLKKTNSTFEFTRRDSLSSVNSVQSCVVPSTTYGDTHRHLSSSRTSLDNVSKRSLGARSSKSVLSKKSTENLSPSLPPYIVQSSICPRTRPKVKHSGRVTEAEHNPQNPPMFKTHKKDSEGGKPTDSAVETGVATTADTPLSSPANSSKPPLGWTASFDADFDSFEKNRQVSKKTDANVDPFTGLDSHDLKIPSSNSAIFEDTAWGSASTIGPEKSEQFAEPFKDDPFAKVGALDFDADPFSSQEGASPFDGVDPFADVKMGDPLADPFSAFEDDDIFGENNTNELSTIKTTVRENLDSDTLKDAETMDSDGDVDRHPSSSDEPTFPKGSEEFTIHLPDLKSINTTSADSSSLTSGMSSPIVASSPVHCAKTASPLTTSTNSSVPPPLPPRLPPRPPRYTIPESPEHNVECPSVPPPPLPDVCSTPPYSDASDDELFFEECDEVLADTPDTISNTPQLPPAIPQRSSKSISSSGHSSESEKTKEPLVRHKSFDIPLLQSGGSGGPPKNSASYSDDLFALSSPAAEPLPQPGAKMTTNQILAGFGGAGGGMNAQHSMGMGPQGGMFAAQPGMMAPPAQYGGVYQQQPASMPFPQNAPAQQYGMFPSGPSPAIPPRPGAMRPPAPQLVPGGAPQNPFGDAAGGTAGMLSPSSQAQSGQAEEVKGKPDPFSNLLGGMGGTGAVNKKDMFKNFQMAKPPQPPPRTNPPPNTNGGTQAPPAKSMSEFDNYFLNSVGGVPLVEDSENNNVKAPVAAPRTGAGDADPFADLSGSNDASDPFGSNNAFAQPYDFNQNANNNAQSLFG